MVQVVDKMLVHRDPVDKLLVCRALDPVMAQVEDKMLVHRDPVDEL